MLSDEECSLEEISSKKRRHSGHPLHYLSGWGWGEALVTKKRLTGWSNMWEPNNHKLTQVMMGTLGRVFTSWKRSNEDVSPSVSRWAEQQWWWSVITLQLIIITRINIVLMALCLSGNRYYLNVLSLITFCFRIPSNKVGLFHLIQVFLEDFSHFPFRFHFFTWALLSVDPCFSEFTITP